MIEAIAGLSTTTNPVAARREAMEEAGLRLAALEHVTRDWTDAGLSTERMDLFLAEYARPTASLRAAARRRPRGYRGDRAAARNLADMVDGKQDGHEDVVLAQTLRLRRGELFD